MPDLTQSQYTVQPGDTISKISQSLNVAPNLITGYRSGDPNLIFPGEILNVNQSPTPVSPAVPNPVSPIASPTPTPSAPTPTSVPGSTSALTPAAPASVPSAAPTNPNVVPETSPSAPATPTAPTTAPTATSPFGIDVESILNKYGIKPPSPTDTSFSSFLNNYKDLYTSLGLTDVKTRIQDVTKQLQAIEEKRLGDLAEIQNNPFVAQSIRSDQIARINQKAEAKSTALTSRLKLDESLYEQGRLEAQFVAEHAQSQFKAGQELTKEIAFKAIDLAEKRAEAERALGKDQITTVNNLIQNYPDAGILPSDSLLKASQKASQSQSFQNKNVMVRAVVDPVNGGVTYYYSKGGAEAKPGTIIGGGNVVPSAGQPGQVRVPPIIAASLEKAGDFQYIDMSKLAPGQIPLAQRTSVANNIPLLSKGDADKVQESNQAYLSASSLIQKVRDLTKNVITASNDRFSMGRQAFELNYTEQFPVLSTNNNAKEFIAARKSLLSLITRASGERGVLTDNDVNRIAQALPSYGDNKELGIAKANNLNEVIKSVFQGAIGAYIGNVQTGGTATGSTTGNLQQLRTKYNY